MDDILHQVIEKHQNDWYSKSQEAMRELSYKFIALATAALVMQIIVLIFKRRERHRTFERMNIPGPKPNLIHGHLYLTRRQPYVQFAHEMHEKYGQTVGMYLGGDPYLMTKDLELIQQVFVAKSRLFFDRMDFYLNIDPVPDNLICQKGDRWRYMRKLLTPAFSHSRIKSSYLYRDTLQTVRKFTRQLERNSELVEVELDGHDHHREGNATSRSNEQITQSKMRQVTFVEDSYDRMAALALDVIVKTAFHMDNMISFSGPLNAQAAKRLANQSPNSKDHQEESSGQTKPNPTSVAKQEVFLSTVKQACRLAFNPLVELIFCFPFLDLPLTFLCNHLYFGSIIQLLFNRLDYLVRRSDTKPTTGVDKRCSDSIQAPNDKQKLHQKHQDHHSQHRRRIIDSLIEVLREKKITKSEFTGNAFVIVFAGFETTANALTFTLWLLAKHQHVQKKLRSELQEQVKQAKGFQHDRDDHNNNHRDESEQVEYESNLRDVEYAELVSGCDYLEMVLNESLRLYPPVPALSCRQASVDCTLANGIHIERGVNVIPSVFSIHRDKTIWGEAANEFEPERFEVLDVNQLNSAMFMPFGFGPRNCIGKALAMQEMKIVIGHLVLKYSIEFCSSVTPEELRLCSPINITITSVDKIGLKFIKLNQ